MKLNVKKLQKDVEHFKQGGKLIPKGQYGLKTNYIEPFHNSPYNFLNKPMSADINYESTIPFYVEEKNKKIDKQELLEKLIEELIKLN